MRTLAKYWKVILAFLLVLAAIPVFFTVYLPGRHEFEAENDRLNQNIASLQETIAANARYADIQDQLPAALEELDASRRALYQNFSSEVREEDQLAYLIDLEEQFGKGSSELGFNLPLYEQFYEKFGVRISFSFGEIMPVALLSDGAVLKGQTITVYFSGGYENVKNMIEYIAEDSRLTSIQYASMDWDEQHGGVLGSFTLLCYLLDSDLVDYQEPNVAVSGIGKPDIFN